MLRKSLRISEKRKCDSIGESNNLKQQTLGTPFAFRRRRIPSEKEGEWEILAVREDFNSSSEPYIVPLSRHGSMKIYLGLIPEDLLKNVENEMASEVKWRQYKVQNENEPRIHALYHSKAPDPPLAREESNIDSDTDPLADKNYSSPGYVYGSVTLKARSLNSVPEIDKLMKFVGRKVEVDYFELGAEALCYKGPSQRMGKHSDSKQGESLIFAAIIKSPQMRFLFVESKDKNEEIEEFKFMLRAGDCHYMDGVMQHNYVHYVPKEKHQCFSADLGIEISDESMESVYSLYRLVVIFRCGTEVWVKKDTGRPALFKYQPKTIPYRFGPINNLVPGNVYNRSQMVGLQLHSCQQRSVSGNKDFGCDSIIVTPSGRLSNIEEDQGDFVLFGVEQRNGGLAMMKSFENGEWIRVFRKLPQMGSNTSYIYGGLFKILTFTKPSLEICAGLKGLSKKVMANMVLFILAKWNCGESQLVEDPSPTIYPQLIEHHRLMSDQLIIFDDLVQVSHGCLKLKFDLVKLAACTLEFPLSDA